MKFEDLKNKKILILGFGREGMSIFHAIKKQFPETSIAVADQKMFDDLTPEAKKIIASSKNVDQFFGPEYLSSLQKYELVVKSPGVLWHKEVEVMKEKGRLISGTNIFFETIGREKIIGVTGSKGKSTTATLLYEMLKASGKNVFLVGNVGHSAMDFIDERGENSLFVYELSSYQLEDLSLSPHMALWVTFFPQHLRYHGGLDAYLEAKKNIVRFQTSEDFFIYNARYRELLTLARIFCGKAIPYNHRESYHLLDDWIFLGQKKLASLKGFKLLGKHNKENAVAAFAVAHVRGVEVSALQKGIEDFSPLPHRLEYLGNFQEREFYNDSIAVAPEATLQALETFGRKVGSILLGGVDNSEDFSILAKRLFEYKISTVILLGQNRKKIISELRRQSLFYEKKEMYEPHIVEITENDGSEAMKKAVKTAFQYTQKGKICLLSPASQSYDLFGNFEERGNLFKKYIEQASVALSKKDFQFI